MRKTKSVFLTVTMVFLAFSLAIACTAFGAGSITLTPTAQAPSGSLNVVGTGFGAMNPVGIGFGAEVNVTNEPFNMTGPFGTGTGPYTGTVPHLPIKPGTFRKSENLSGDIFTLFDTDNGNGTFSSRLAASFVNGTINYVTGQYTLFTTIAIPSNLVYRINYTYYQNNATPVAGITTNSSGTFTALAYVPAVANGTYVVTAIDTHGNIATATVNVNSTIPEVPSFGVALLLSSVAVLASSQYFRKRLKTANWN